jgi:hypothetical protein
MNPSKTQTEISPEQWQKHFKTIKQLFITEDHTLSEVKKIMESHFSFRATWVFVKVLHHPKLANFRFRQNCSIPQPSHRLGPSEEHYEAEDD